MNTDISTGAASSTTPAPTHIEDDDAGEVEVFISPDEMQAAEVVVGVEEGDSCGVDDDDDIEMDDGEGKGEGEGEGSSVDAEDQDQLMDGEGDWDHAFTGHSGEVYCASFHPTDPLTLATGGGDDKAFVWSLKEDVNPTLLKHHNDSVVSIGYSHDGQFLATAGMDGLIVVWDREGKKVVELEGCGEVQFMQWHSKGSIIVAGGSESTVWLWAIPSGQVMRVFSGHAGAVTCGYFTPDGKTVVSGGEDGTVRIWKPKDGQCQDAIQPHAKGLTNSVTAMAISNDSSIAAVSDVDGNIILVQISNGRILAKINNGSGSVEAMEFCKTHPLLVSGDVSGKLCLWDSTSWKIRADIALNDAVVCVKWCTLMHAIDTENGEKIDAGVPVVVTGCADGAVNIWDGRNLGLIRSLKGHSDAVLSIDVTCSQDGLYIVTGGSDSTVFVFQV